MEPVGVALGAVVLVKPIITTVANLIQSEQNFGSDAEIIRVRFQAQQHRLEAMEKVLFEPRWQRDQEKSQLWSMLPDSTQANVVDMLHQLYLLLNDFVAIKARYNLSPAPGNDLMPLGDLAVSEGIVLSDTRKELVSLGTLQAKKKRHSIKWVRRLWWATYEKKTVVSLVDEFEKWNDRLKELIETVWWPLPFLSSIASIEHVAKDDDILATRLMHDVEVRKLLMSTSQPSSDIMSHMGAEKDDFTSSGQLHGFEFGTARLKDGQSPVMVEFKSYGQNEDKSIDETDLKRIRQLAQLLNQQDDDRFRILHCMALFNDIANNQYGLIFSIPTQLQSKPTNLKEQLVNSRKGRPSLEARLRLAHALAESLLLLHSVGWIHQSFRSDNVLLFPPESVLVDQMTTDDIIDNFEPRICGFEFSRSMNAYSYRHSGIEPWKNLYRHPERWGRPTETFDRYHDVYALGVVLLEIGLWERVDALDRGSLLSEAGRYQAPSAFATKEGIKTVVSNRLLRHVDERLGFYMSTHYQGAVRKCLDDTFKNRGPVDTQAAVAQDVVRVLAGLLRVIEDPMNTHN